MTEEELADIMMDEAQTRLKLNIMKVERTIGMLNGVHNYLDELKSELKDLEDFINKWWGEE